MSDTAWQETISLAEEMLAIAEASGAIADAQLKFWELELNQLRSRYLLLTQETELVGDICMCPTEYDRSWVPCPPSCCSRPDHVGREPNHGMFECSTCKGWFPRRDFPACATRSISAESIRSAGEKITDTAIKRLGLAGAMSALDDVPKFRIVQ